MRQERSEGNGQHNHYQHIYIEFFNIIQPAWDIPGDEAHNKDIFMGENVS